MANSTKQRAALKDLALSFLEESPDCAVIFDHDWLIVYANQAFQSKFCGSREAEGSSFLSYLDEESKLKLRELQPHLFHTAQQVELTCVTPDSMTASRQYSFFRLPMSTALEKLLAGIGRDRTADVTLLNEVIQLNIALEHKRKELSEANARLEMLAITDHTTQLYNRRYFFEVAQHFWEDSKRYKIPMVTIMIDFDNFKSVNDTYGHIFGDHVLREASMRLRINTRKSDILSRYGGEELALLASSTDMPTGLVLAERLRAAVASEPFVLGNYSANVTISLGVSGTELGDFPTFEALLASSDSALYVAKRSGKNRFAAYGDSKAAHP